MGLLWEWLLGGAVVGVAAGWGCCGSGCWVGLLWEWLLGGAVVRVAVGWDCCGSGCWVGLLWEWLLGGAVVRVAAGWGCCGSGCWVGQLWEWLLGGAVVWSGFTDSITLVVSHTNELEVTADLGNLATGSQTVGSRYLGYEPKLYTTMMSHSPYPR